MNEYFKKLCDSVMRDYEVNVAGFCDCDGRTHPVDYERCYNVYKFLDSIPTINKVNTSIPSSYGLKHSIEKRLASQGIHGYISNGELIVAAIIRGWKYIRQPINPHNCYFNIGKKAYKELIDVTGGSWARNFVPLSIGGVSL